jgi:hypothetical protein
MKLRFALTDTACAARSDGGGQFVLVKPNGSMLWRYKFKLGGREKPPDPGPISSRQARRRPQGASRREDQTTGRVAPSAARQAERAERQVAEAEAALRETTFGSVADKWLKTRVPVKAKDMKDKEIKKRFKTYARDDRMVGYLKDGKETAPGLGRVIIDRVELGHFSPILKAGLWPKDRHSPISISPLALRSIGRRIGQRSPTPSNSASFSGRSKSMWGAVIT